MVKFISIFAVALLAVAIPSTLVAGQAPQRPAETAECLKSSGASEADVFARPRIISEPVSCFWKCVLEKKGVIKPDGTFNVELSTQGFPKASTKFTDQQIADLKKCFTDMGKISACADMKKIRDCFATNLKKN